MCFMDVEKGRGEGDEEAEEYDWHREKSDHRKLKETTKLIHIRDNIVRPSQLCFCSNLVWDVLPPTH